MKKIVLCGIKHSGKSTLGKLLAQKLNALFFDIDTVIETEEGMNVRELYKTYGEQAFMEAETHATKKILDKLKEVEHKHDSQDAHKQPEQIKNTQTTQLSQTAQVAVIATGGGICDNQEALSLLQKNSLLIFLDIPKEIAFNRIKANAKKTNSMPAYIANKNPKNEEEEREIFYSYYERRKERYENLCHAKISVDASVEKNIENILELPILRNYII